VQTTSTTTQRIPRPFHVSRTPGNNFPVYQLRKRGGNKKLTTIKKIEGDRKAFKEVLATGLGLDPKDVKINPVTGHVVVEVRLHT
jgi:large subunit ribosomal protein L49